MHYMSRNIKKTIPNSQPYLLTIRPLMLTGNNVVSFV